MSSQYDYLYKVIFIGDSDTGKSSLSQRIAHDSFNPTYIETIGVDFFIKYIKISGKIIKLQMWDTAGADRFRSITKSYFRGSNIIFLVYDVTNLNSFKNIKNWMKDIEDFKKEKVYIVLVGNKCDSLDRVITEEEGKKFADYYKMDYIEVSAKNDKNIFELFCRILSNKLKSKDENKMQGEQTLAKTTTEFLNNKNSSFYFIYVIILLVTLIIILLIIFKIT